MRNKTYAKYIVLLPLLVLIFIVVSANFTPGVWLNGWDNLHSEFNLGLNIKRALFSVWQEYQGLGLLGGMGHAADLPRLFIIWLTTFIIPTNFIRYFLVLLMLALGSVGLWFFVNDLFKKRDILTRSLIGFLASSFYLLNLGTVQNFYVPFEPYYWFYGMLPWLLLLFTRYLEKGGKKGLLLFLGLTFFAAPIGYLQTAFVTYFILVISIGMGFVLFAKKRKSKKKRFSLTLKTLVFALLVNAFWLLPVGYFTLTKSHVTVESKMNSIATSEMVSSNSAYGNLADISLLKGYWLGLHDWGEVVFEYLLNPWVEHLETNWITTLGFVLFGIVVLGVIYSIKKRLWIGIGFGIFFCLSLFILVGTNSPFGFVFNLVKNYIPLFSQIFRSPFTKIIVPLSLTYSVLMAFGLDAIFTISKKKRKIFVAMNILITALVFSGILYIGKPVFEGNLFYKRIKQDIPPAYTELVEFMKSQPKDMRIAIFPVHTFWGWSHYDWGHRGSGFLWYGIEQPIIDRTFDVWSGENETFYHQASTAVYRGDSALLQKTLSKYDVDLILLDTNIYIPGEDDTRLAINKTIQYLVEIKAKVIWSEGGIVLYKLDNDDGADNFVYAPKYFIETKSDSTYSREDTVFDKYGNYIETGNVVFPFQRFYKERLDQVSFSKKGGFDLISINQDLEIREKDYRLVIPGIEKGQKLSLPITAGFDGKEINIKFEDLFEVEKQLGLEIFNTNNIQIDVPGNNDRVLVAIGDESIDLENGKVVNFFVDLVVGEPFQILIFDDDQEEIDLSTQFESQEVSGCWTREGEDGLLETNSENGVLNITTGNAAGCMSFKLGNAANTKELLTIKLPFRSMSQARPDFCILKEGEVVNCENKDVFYTTTSSENWKEVTRSVILQENVSYWLSVVGRPPDMKDEQWSIDYKAPQVVKHSIIGSVDVDETFWSEYLTQEVLNLSLEDEITLNFRVKPIEIDFRNSIDTVNCDVFERGSIDKDVGSERISYTATNGASLCDSSLLKGVDPTGHYLLRVLGEGVKERGMKLYLYNQTTARNDLEVLLPTGKFDEIYSILPIGGVEDKSNNLRLETRSFGGTSKNILEEVNFYRFPINWIAGFYLTSDLDSFNKLIDSGAVDIQTKENLLTIDSVEKIYTYKYIVDLEGSGVLALSQSFDDGWMGFSTKTKSPYIFGKKLKHFKLNSWSNAFVVEDECSGGCRVTIIYLPQYLEFAGFLILIILMALLIKKSSRRVG